MTNKFTIEIDDQFRPKAVKLVTSNNGGARKVLLFDLGDGKSSDNHGGGGMVQISEGDTVMNMHIPKAAVAALVEIFKNR